MPTKEVPMLIEVPLPDRWIAVVEAKEPVRFKRNGRAYDLANAVKSGLLVAVRGARGHTQAEAAETMGVSPQAVSYWETGRRGPRGLYSERLTEYVLSV